MAGQVETEESGEIAAAGATWAALDTLRVGRWGEQFFGMALTRAGLDVYQPFVDDRSIDLLVRLDGDPVRYAELQIKTVRVVRPSYVFMRKRLFPISPMRFLGLVVLIEGRSDPDVYLIPSSVWNEPRAPFVSRDYVDQKSEPEHGLTVSAATLGLLEPYRLERQLPRLASGISVKL